MFPRISTLLRLAAAPVLVITACLAAPVLASNEEYLVQQVCLDSGGNVTNADPYSCSTKRALNPGEPLPYHKTDYDTTPSNTSDILQVSDSFPISGTSIAVQTMFFLNDNVLGSIDPRWPNDMVHFNPKHGGFNILGADSNYLYIRGTFDQSGGWQPWWTSNCAAQGWLLAPNTTISSAGSTSVATQHYPECPGTVPVASASVQWGVPASFTYSTGKQIQSIISTHIAPGGGQLELVYLTKIYGVTRWEAWRPTSDGDGPTSDLIQARCPNVSHTKTLNGISYYMKDCRDWSSIKPLTDFWDPNGRAPNDANVLTWPVDPLYTTANLLKNTHIGGSYTSSSTTSTMGCIVNGWDRVNSPYVLNWAFDTGSTDIAPFYTPERTKNCILHFSTPGAGGGQALYQVQMITPGSTGPISFGAMLWAPDYTSGAKPGVLVRLFQRDSSGGLISYSDINAELTNQPATYAGSATRSSSTASVTLAFYPLKENVEHLITGAWVAHEPVDLTPPARCYNLSGIIVACP